MLFFGNIFGRHNKLCKYTVTPQCLPHEIRRSMLENLQTQMGRTCHHREQEHGYKFSEPNQKPVKS